MPFEPIDPSGARASFSPATRAGNAVHISGVIAVDAAGDLRGPGNIRIQTQYVLDQLERTLATAGASLADVAVTQVFLRYRGDFAAFDEVYAGHFAGTKPARTCVIAELLHPDALVEIAAIAYPD